MHRLSVNRAIVNKTGRCRRALAQSCWACAPSSSAQSVTAQRHFSRKTRSTTPTVSDLSVCCVEQAAAGRDCAEQSWRSFIASSPPWRSQHSLAAVLLMRTKTTGPRMRDRAQAPRPSACMCFSAAYRRTCPPSTAWATVSCGPPMSLSRSLLDDTHSVGGSALIICDAHCDFLISTCMHYARTNLNIHYIP